MWVDKRPLNSDVATAADVVVVVAAAVADAAGVMVEKQ